MWKKVLMQIHVVIYDGKKSEITNGLYYYLKRLHYEFNSRFLTNLSCLWSSIVDFCSFVYIDPVVDPDVER